MPQKSEQVELKKSGMQVRFLIKAFSSFSLEIFLCSMRQEIKKNEMKEEKRKFINFQTFFIFSLLRFCVFLLSHFFFFYFLLYVFVHRLPVLDFCNMQKKSRAWQRVEKFALKYDI